MSAAPAQGRGPLFWVLVAGGGLGGCCVVSLLGLVVLGALGTAASSDEAPGPVAAAKSVRSAAPPSAEPDDFVWKAENGLEYIAPSRVAAEGVQVSLAGEWREDHHNLILRLRDGGRYELSEGGAVMLENSLGQRHADAVSTAEQGTWQFEGGVLTLSPEARELSAISGTRDLGSSAQQADAPRQWTLTGVTLAYTPHGANSERERPALHIRGPTPSWAYPSGTWDYVLRSAPWSR